MRQGLKLRQRLRLLGRLVLDIFAFLLFAMFTASMVAQVLERSSWSGRAMASPFLAAGLYFLVRGVQNLWLTVADARSGAYLPAQPQHR